MHLQEAAVAAAFKRLVKITVTFGRRSIRAVGVAHRRNTSCIAPLGALPARRPGGLGVDTLISTSLLTLALLAGCQSTDGAGYGEVVLYDQPVVCDALADSCRTPGGAAAPFVYHKTIVFLSRGASQYGKNAGIYLHMEIYRGNGATGVLELDVPTGYGVSLKARDPLVSYMEFAGNKRVFQSTRARGKVEVPLEAACPCQDGRLELVLTDPGNDGKLDTVDDRVRRLSRGLFGASGTTCQQPKMHTVVTDREVEVSGLVNCVLDPAPSSSGGNRGGGDYYYDDTSGGCVVHDDGGCDGDTYDDGSSSSDYGSGGCEGDSSSSSDDDSGGCEGDSSSSSDDDSGGCEGDSSSSSYDDSGGCEGDSSSSSSSCEGDAYAAGPTFRRGPAHGALRQIQRALGLGFPITCALAIILTHRSRRRRATR